MIYLTMAYLTQLNSKHSPAAEVKQDSLLLGPINELFRCCFYEIDEVRIAKAASLTQGAGEPSVSSYDTE